MAWDDFSGCLLYLGCADEAMGVNRWADLA
jgi:hypothetical protein